MGGLTDSSAVIARLTQVFFGVHFSPRSFLASIFARKRNTRDTPLLTNCSVPIVRFNRSSSRDLILPTYVRDRFLSVGEKKHGGTHLKDRHIVHTLGKENQDKTCLALVPGFRSKSSAGCRDHNPGVNMTVLWSNSLTDLGIEFCSTTR